MFMDKVTAYFNGDSMAAINWQDKYQMKDPSNPTMILEDTPDDMHLRLAKEFARVEYNHIEKEVRNVYGKVDTLSEFGRKLYHMRTTQLQADIVSEFYEYFKGFGQIVPQGSIMANLGNKYVFGSLSNCFGIAPPEDSYGGIMRADQELIQLMKRRGGVGTHLSTLRPAMSLVSNASKSSTGVVPIAERYSNSTREVAQEGRRGAFMILLHVQHPDIFRFVSMKEDRTKVTGANVSVIFNNDFMRAVENDEDYLCCFPIKGDVVIEKEEFEAAEYNGLYMLGYKYWMKIRAKELFNEFVHMAHSNAEPGAAFEDRIIDYSPDGVYEAYVPEVCNPCGEQWFHAYETCRLIAMNFMGIIDKPFTKEAKINFDRLYEIAYMQQRLGDNLVDLEVEYIDRILQKIHKDPESWEIKTTERNLWNKVRKLAETGRRTGNGFTALGDLLAAVNLPYYSPEAVEEVMKTKMRAELDATIDMAILRGTFTGWDGDKEFTAIGGTAILKDGSTHSDWSVFGKNSFFEMIATEFPEQAKRMYKYGRRNVSWSTVAPTGTVSLMTQTTSGIEPLFEPWYTRKKKINANQTGVRIDEVDQNGDSWQYFFVLHPQFKEWIKTYIVSNMEVVKDGLLKGYKFERRDIDNDVLEDLITWLNKDQIHQLFEISPWYGSCANDFTVEQRIHINSIVQKYTSNSISCTVNLHKDVTEEFVYDIYFQAWKAGLKGITIYRDTSRSGVLVKEVKQITIDEFGYTDAPKRPVELDADYYFVKVAGKDFAVIVGKLSDNPYELFAFHEPKEKQNLKGEIIKIKSGQYAFKSPNYEIENIQTTNHPDEALLCRMISGMLRHGMNPKYIADQVDKSEIGVVSFGKAIQRVLKSYIPDEELEGETCPQCEKATLRREEGCKRCPNCGYSKC